MYTCFMQLYVRIFATPRLVHWNNFLVTLGLHGLGIDNYQNDLVSGERYILQKFLGGKMNPIFIDVGAHVGDSAILAKQMCQSARIYSFEPNPTTYKILSKEGKKHGFKTYNAGVGSKSGKMTLYDSRAGDGSPFASLYPSVIQNIHQQKLIRHSVAMTTIDIFYKRYLKSKQVTLLKVDVEGYELEVLKGAKNTVKSGKISAIQFEFNKMNVESRVFFQDFVELLPDWDFYRLLPHGTIKISSQSLLGSEIFGYQNILAVKKI